MTLDPQQSETGGGEQDVISLIAAFERRVSHSSFSEIARGALSFMTEFLHVDRASVALVRKEGDGFRIFDTTMAVEGVESGRIVAHGSASLTEAVERRETIYRPDIRLWPSPNPVDRAFVARGILCTVSVPLVTGGQCGGTLNAASKTVDGIAPNTRMVIELVAPRLAHALEMGFALDALAENEAYLRDIFETVVDGIAVVDPVSRRLITVNSAFAELVGRSMTDLVGLALTELHSPEDLASVVPLFDAMARGEVDNRPDVLVRRPSGETVPVDISARSTVLSGKPCAVAVFRDARMRREREAERVQVQKLESIRTLAGGIAHDFNNLLTGLVGNVTLSQMLLGEGDEARRLLDEALGAATRATALTRQLLTFAKGGTPVRTRVDVVAILRDATAVAGCRGCLQVEFDVSEEPCWLLGDAGQLAQVFQNLVRNAAEAMPSGGVLGVRVGRESAVDGEQVVIELSDHGVGIAPELLDKVFLPFYSTKEGGKGLGLAVAYSIVHHHGGQIGVVSTVAKGTSFRVTLPVADVQKPIPTVCAEKLSLTGRLLVMDDEPMVLEVARRVLVRAGYVPRVVTNGADAVEAYRGALAQGERFDAVILDLTVSFGMGGREAAQGILAVDPTARLMVSSGYSEDALMAEFRRHGFLAVLPKPYSAQQLCSAVQDMLAAEGPAGPEVR
jgi:PAS domain S-box-containing protein